MKRICQSVVLPSWIKFCNHFQLMKNTFLLRLMSENFLHCEQNQYGKERKLKEKTCHYKEDVEKFLAKQRKHSSKILIFGYLVRFQGVG